jgi:hypothetical protein
MLATGRSTCFAVQKNINRDFRFVKHGLFWAEIIHVSQIERPETILDLGNLDQIPPLGTVLDQIIFDP